MVNYRYIAFLFGKYPELYPLIIRCAVMLEIHAPALLGYLEEMWIPILKLHFQGIERFRSFFAYDGFGILGIRKHKKSIVDFQKNEINGLGGIIIDEFETGTWNRQCFDDILIEINVHACAPLHTWTYEYIHMIILAIFIYASINP